MKVVIIGTGNVATVFGRLLSKTGHDVIQVFGRTQASAKELADQLDCSHTGSWNEINRQADLYLVAIADKALYELNQHLSLSHQLIVHTAGSVSKSVLKHTSINYGVMYPLQSLHKGMPVLTEIPLLVDANNEEAMEQIMLLAGSLTTNISAANDDQRLKLHLAAVVINNFVNHLYVITADFCEHENIRFDLLLPLMTETSKRMEFASPGQMLTGPAIRNDQVTIAKHINLLRAYPLLLKQYKQLTESILRSQSVMTKGDPMT
ncbi:MAG: DUF2520 domain-containing protein [Chitinophagaceae bacterium]